MDHRRVKKGRKVFEHRRGRWDKDAVVPDVDALKYFAAAGITNEVERNAANRLILTLKRLQVWNGLKRCYLFSPTSLAASQICAKTLTTATLVNSPSHSSSGLAFVAASSQRMDTGLVWDSTNFTMPSMHMAVSISGIDNSLTSQYFAGINTASYRACAREVSTSNKAIQWSSFGTLTCQIDGTGSTDMYGHAVIITATSARFIRNTGAMNSSGGSALNAITNETFTFPIGCTVTAGPVYSNYCTGTFKFFAVGNSYITATDNDRMSRYWRAVNEYNQRLGR